MRQTDAQRWCLTYCGCTFWRNDECTNECFHKVWEVIKGLVLAVVAIAILTGTGRAVLEIPTLRPVNATLPEWLGGSVLTGAATWALVAYAICLALCVRDVWRACSGAPRGVGWRRWCTMRENPHCLMHRVVGDDTSPAAIDAGYYMARLDNPPWAVRGTLLFAAGTPIVVAIVAALLGLLYGLYRLLVPPIALLGLLTSRAFHVAYDTCGSQSARNVSQSCWYREPDSKSCPCGAIGMMSTFALLILVWLSIAVGQCVLNRIRQPPPDDGAEGEAIPLLPVHGS